MARLPYTNFHDLNLDFVLKVIKKAFTPDNPPPYPVKSVNGMTGNVTVTGDVIPIAPNNPAMVTDVLREKQDAPASPGTPGQVLGLDANQTPVWIDQPNPESIIDDNAGGGDTDKVYSADYITNLIAPILDDITDINDDIDDLNNNKAPIIIDSASGAIATFPDGADDLPVESMTVQIEPVQSGSGDPSPSNIRPISGWTGCNVTVAPTASADDPDKTVYPITWQTEAGTVYGGTLNPVTGELVADMALVDLGSLQWYLDTNRPGVFYTDSLQSTAVNRGKIIADIYSWRSSSVPSVSNLENNNNSISLFPSYGGGYIYTIDTAKAAMTALEYKTAMQGVMCAYQIQNPITYTLTPLEIRTLLGVNNIWADTGNVSVDYRADTKLYIQRLTQPAEDDLIANAPIASGNFFMIGNNLYRATTNIAQGATITIGTNASAISLADALNALI